MTTAAMEIFTVRNGCIVLNGYSDFPFERTLVGFESGHECHEIQDSYDFSLGIFKYSLMQFIYHKWFIF